MRPALGRFVLTMFVLVLALGLSPAQQNEPPEGEQPPADKPLVIPEAEKNRKNPYAGDIRSIDNGGELFQTQCTMCHGTSGDGKGDLVARLGLKVPDFTDPAVQKRRTDGELFFILTHGHRDMPGEGARFSEDWRWDLVNYIRTLKR